MFTQVVKDSDDMVRLQVRLAQSPQPFTVSVVAGEKRTNPQNKTIHGWYGEIARHLGDTPAEKVRAECKLQFGVPILRRDDAEFRDWYDSAIRWMEYEQKREMFLHLDPQVTSKMTVKQLSEYMETMMRHFSEAGVILTDPSLQGYEQ